MIIAMATVANAKRKMVPVKTAQETPKRNIFDLRKGVFVCLADGCYLDISHMHIVACGAEGCALLTDIVAPIGPVQRLVPETQPPAAAVPKTEAPKKK